MNIADYKGVWVFAEQREGELQKVSLELLGEGRRQADKLGVKLTAARLNTGLTADCTSIDVEVENGDLLATRPAFGGNLMATIACPDHRPQMATVRPGVFEKVNTNGADCKIEKVAVQLSDSDVRTKVLETVKTAKDIVDISEAKIIVAGGRGVGSKENFDLVKELAEALGGVVAGSRAAVEKGWVENAYQVGQTGKTVKPTIYVACGISGAIQHVAGMQDSEVIIAINKDETAPIMQVADYGIVGDLKKVIPELIAQVKAIKDAE